MKIDKEIEMMVSVYCKNELEIGNFEFLLRDLCARVHSQAVQDCIEALDKVPFYSELVERGNQGEFDVNNLRKITTIDKEEAQQSLKKLK